MAGNDALMVLFSANDLVVDAAGPDPVVVQTSECLSVELADDPLLVQFVAAGMPGRDGADGGSIPVETVAAATMVAGTPVAIDRTTGQLIRAAAAYKPSAFVIGLLADDVAQGFVGAAERSLLTLPDWSAIAGAPQLAAGQSYFLAEGGGLSPTPPDSACVALIGRAVSPTTLLIDVQPPIER
jgi:hypothetical protein